MILDDLDIHIIKEILKKQETSTWKIANCYYWFDKPNKFNTKNCQFEFFNSKTNLICYRIKKLSEEGIIKIEKNGNRKNIYVLKEGECFISKHKFPDKNKDALTIKTKEGKWMIVEL